MGYHSNPRANHVSSYSWAMSAILGPELLERMNQKLRRELTPAPQTDDALDKDAKENG